MMKVFFNVLSFLYTQLEGVWLFRVIRDLFKNPKVLFLVIIIALLAGNQIRMSYNSFSTMYDELNNPDEDAAAEDEPGLEFKQIDDNLYTLTGPVKEGDCEKIVPLLPQQFTVILESPGGSLADGSCLAAHLKLRDVVTVVRDTPVYNENGRNVYQPGLIATEDSGMVGKTMCASACGLLFLAGDVRYLIGDVWFGIHAPATPADSIGSMHPLQVESSTLRVASNLLNILKRLGVTDPDVRELFIQIPNANMYWLKPEDFQAKPGLIFIATNYRNFWGFTGTNPFGGLE
jgi:hypothetical protein